MKSFFKIFAFIFYVIWELVLSSVRVAKVVLSPGLPMRPGVIAVPVDLKSEWGIVVLANSITLTPGTLSLLVSENKKTLYVHGMFIDDPATFRREVKSMSERKISEFLK